MDELLERGAAWKYLINLCGQVYIKFENKTKSNTILGFPFKNEQSNGYVFEILASVPLDWDVSNARAQGQN